MLHKVAKAERMRLGEMTHKRRSSSFTLCTPEKLLLQLRDAQAPRYPNHWGFFGGGVEPGETHLDAVIREAQEELQLDISGFQPWTAGQFESADDIVMFYVLPWTEAYSLEQLRSQQREGSNLDLFTYEDALSPHRLLVPSDRPLIEAWHRAWGR